MSQWITFPRHATIKGVCHAEGMSIRDKDVEGYRALIREIEGRELSFGEAKEEFTRIMHLWWIVRHRPPEEGEAPYNPPPPPWL